MKLAEIIPEREKTEESKSEDARIRKISGVKELPDFEDLVAKGGVKKLDDFQDTARKGGAKRLDVPGISGKSGL